MQVWIYHSVAVARAIMKWKDHPLDPNSKEEGQRVYLEGELVPVTKVGRVCS